MLIESNGHLKRGILKKSSEAGSSKVGYWLFHDKSIYNNSIISNEPRYQSLFDGKQTGRGT